MSLLLPWLCLFLLLGTQYWLWQWSQRYILRQPRMTLGCWLLPALPLLWPVLLGWLASLLAAWARCDGSAKSLSCHGPSGVVVESLLGATHLALALIWFVAIPLGFHLLTLVRERHEPD